MIERGKRIQDNVVLERCQKNFFRCLEEATAYKRDGKVHRVLGRAIRKGASDTRNAMVEKVKNQLGEKVQRAQEVNIQGINVRTRIMKRKNLEAPGTDRWKMVENVCFNVRCRLKNKNGLED